MGYLRLSPWLALALASAVCTSASDAHAFTTASSVTKGCHERITFDAIQAAGWPGGVRPPTLSEPESRILRDTIFEYPPFERNPWALAMLLGNRHVDLQGHEPTNLPEIAREAALPSKQRDHCLRARPHDGAAGDQEAVNACRDYIMENIEAALGSGATLDLNTQEGYEVALDFRGPIVVDLNRYGFRMGQALHALQDAFSHHFRAPDGMSVRHVLNYVDHVDKPGYEPEVDGFQHVSKLDRCGPGIPNDQRDRVDQATQASTELLRAINDSAGGRTGRLQRAETVLNKWFNLEAGCTLDNDYCGSKVEPASGACSASPMARGLGAGWLVSLVAAFAALRRRRVRFSRWKHVAFAAAVFALIGSVPLSALAQPSDPLEKEDPALDAQSQQAQQMDEETEAQVADDVAVSPNASEDMKENVEEAKEESSVSVVDAEPQQEQLEVVTRKDVDAQDMGEPINHGLGLYLGGGAAIDHGAFSAAVGLRYDFTHWFTGGLDVEYNPWVSLSSGNSEVGALNVYATGIFTYGAMGPLEIRTTVSAGVSRLLFDLAAAEEGSMGPFVGITPIGVAFRLNKQLRLVVDPGGFYVPIPQTTGTPLVYGQHRLMVGLHWVPISTR